MRLILHNAEEHADLVEWLYAHYDEDDWPANGDAAADWLRDQRIGTIEVPASYIEVIAYAIDDWAEVLSSHGQELHTHMTEANHG